jgi:predicted Zn-dependent protease
VRISIVTFFVKFGSNTETADFLNNKVIHYPVLVSLININKPGDARFSFLDSSKGKLPVVLIYLRSNKPNSNVDEWIDGVVKQTTARETEITTADLNFVNKSEYSDDDLNEIRNTLVGRFNTEAKLFIVYLTVYKEDISNIGLAKHRDTIFIFSDALNALSGNEDTLARLERSTIMHEWAHLLGAGHVDDPDCIMSELVEVDSGHFLGSGQVPIEYCYETLHWLEKQRGDNVD